MSMTLVLAGGGPAALAWELGVLRGLADADAELAQKVIGAGTVIGTSGGSSLAAQITSGTPLDELYDAQLSAGTAEIEVKLDLAEFMSRFGAAIAGAADETDRRRHVGAFALAASTVPPARPWLPPLDLVGGGGRAPGEPCREGRPGHLHRDRIRQQRASWLGVTSGAGSGWSGRA
ncbi:MAG TPA: patatin-like phospholipase family protein [Trebonia sp.]